MKVNMDREKRWTAGVNRDVDVGRSVVWCVRVVDKQVERKHSLISLIDPSSGIESKTPANTSTESSGARREPYASGK